MILKRILNNQLFLFDYIDAEFSWGESPSTYLEKEILEDDKGKYQWEVYEWYGSCDCHPETCCHFDGRKWKETRTKKYLPVEKKSIVDWAKNEKK